MLGMLGIIVKNNQIKNTTQILQIVKPGELYLVKFLNLPVFSRVCTTEEIQTWLLFDTQDEANAWVESSKQPPPGAQGPGKLSAVAPTTPPAAKPNGSDNDLPDEGTDDPDPEPEITPATPVDASRFERPGPSSEPNPGGHPDGPDPTKDPRHPLDTDPDGWDTPTPEPEPDPGGPHGLLKPRKHNPHKPGKKS